MIFLYKRQPLILVLLVFVFFPSTLRRCDAEYIFPIHFLPFTTKISKCMLRMLQTIIHLSPQFCIWELGTSASYSYSHVSDDDALSRLIGYVSYMHLKRIRLSSAQPQGFMHAPTPHSTNKYSLLTLERTPSISNELRFLDFLAAGIASPCRPLRYSYTCINAYAIKP